MAVSKGLLGKGERQEEQDVKETKKRQYLIKAELIIKKLPYSPEDENQV